MSDSKNGYQLRADLLGMAIGILQDRDSRSYDNECLKPDGQRQPVDAYATEDVLTIAEKLYKFVRTKS
jgi:hypothetical protein